MKFSPKLSWFLTRLGYLLCVASAFYASYGFANYFASKQSFVPEIIFEWEHDIPFIAWTILPYWSLNLLYGLGFLLCKNYRELNRYTAQLLLSQLIAVVFFILFPLQISWSKPESFGISKFLFDSLAAFDMPFNQAPSLHIILCVVVGSLYISKTNKIWIKAIILAWFVLIALSVLTTYQHHFIDIPTGLLVGFLVLAVAPIEGEILKFNLAHTKAHLKWASFYALLAVIFAVLAFWLGGIWLWLLYFSVSFTLVSASYALFGAQLFRKEQNGEISSFWLLLPYLIIARLNIIYWLNLKRAPKSSEILPNVHLGSITEAHKFEAVFDLTAECEFHPRSDQIYANFAMLDMVKPKFDDLKAAVKAMDSIISKNERTLICCALGYGRSALVLLGWLVWCKKMSVDDAILLVKNSRPKVVIDDSVRKFFMEFR
ncbi:phosphatase PAP2/dual specificity phosphatase family protein [Campylobacter sp.]|uniref:phosphatase PAP2/dual specificity phosphatase family protein n=1 Tax=Campylobacter sp. TaxID=205 RepID=UPI0026FFCBD4|nr:phosphatase PAP2/dual specificity phosphatase family protein [Campylobacter sp.]